MTPTTLPRNPHFDDEVVLWDDAYSGRYQPVAYNEQFDRQWRLYLERQVGFIDHTGVETTDEYVDDRIYELTGVSNFLLRQAHGELADDVADKTGRSERSERRGVGGRLYLEPKFPTTFFRNKRCLDSGCGAGRWTRTLMALGGYVTSTDVSPNAIASTKRFNPNTFVLDVFDIPSQDRLHKAFDFVLSWGVVMCTHDPKLAFNNLIKTLAPGGSLYLMVYAPTYHVSDFVLKSRYRYHRELRSLEERARYVLDLSSRNPDNAINYHDMLNTFYNWAISEETIRNWCVSQSLEEPIFLNASEPNKCGHHVLIRRD